jgi:hypothetical protein
VTGLLFPERLLRHNDDQHARAWPSHGLRPLMRTTRSVRISGALGYSVGQVGVPTTASMDRSTHCRAGWKKKKVVSTSSTGYVGRLVALST